MRRTYTAAIRDDGSCLLEMLVVADPPGTATITVSGELSRDSAYTVETITSCLREYHPAHVIVDLCQVGALDSVGLGALLGLQRAAGRAGMHLVVRCVPGPLSRLLRSVGVSHHVQGATGDPTDVPLVELDGAVARPPWGQGRRGGRSVAVLARRWH